MTRLLMALLAAAMSLPAAADGVVACFQDCARQGYEHSRCVTICERDRSGGMFGQPGVPRNPYFNALPDPLPQRQPKPPGPPVSLDRRCMDECSMRGHQYGYCRKHCSY